MYSLVLMAALSGGGEALAWQDESPKYAAAKYGDHGSRQYRGRRHQGCCGCQGGGGGGCWGGSSCGGGCYGSGHGYGGGCYGSGYGGGCYSSGYGCGGCYGSGYGYRSGYYNPQGASYGRSSYYYGSSPYNEMPTSEGDGYRINNGGMYDGNRRYEGERREDGGNDRRDNRPENLKSPREGARDEARANNAATLVVQLPTDAQLSIGGIPTRATSGTRTFISPPLELNQNYYYDLRGEVIRDGKPIVLTKKVKVLPGQEARVSFDFADARNAKN